MTLVARSPTLSLRAKGNLALFTHPAMKVERVSYAVMTPSAARGLLEAVLWKPAIQWRVRRIDVLAPIQFMTFRRNEVNSKVVTPGMDLVREGGHLNPFWADEDRAQRNTVALRDVDYVVHADFDLTNRAGTEDNVTKFVEMFRRRLDRGQHFHQPYLGCREFAADVEPVEGALAPIDDTRDLGIMLWDIDYRADGNRARFFRARLDHGTVHVPENPEATFGSGAAA